MQPTLVHLPYSPWSERARWALDARAVAHRRRTYQPLFGEPELRLRLRRLRGPVTVPLLITGDGVLGDSYDIARWADWQGTGASLFPAGQEDQVRRWHEWSERALCAGRAISLSRIVGSEASLRELVPRPLRRLGGGAVALARFGVARAQRKYGTTARPEQAWREEIAAALEELAQALGADPAAGPTTLLGAFSFADITAAQALISLVPPEDRYLRMGQETRRAFGDPALLARFPQLAAWRDALYARHRGAWVPA